MWSDISVFIFTQIASVYTLYAICVALAVYAWWCGHSNAAVGLLVAAIACGVSVVGLKELFAVARPPNPLIVVDTYAFPSGHATGAAFLGLLVWGYAKYVFARPLAGWVTGLVVMVVLAIGVSRLVFQVHTMTQVLVGYALGVVWASLCIWWWRSNNR